MNYADLARQWTKHQPAVASFINSVIFDFHAAEELLQETGAEVFEHVDRFDETRPFLPWALGIAKNVVLKHQRTAARDRHVFNHDALENLAQAAQTLSEQGDHVARFLDACRRRLTRRAREVCRLRYEMNLGRDEIAASQGMTSQAVKIMLHRVRDQLRECIERRLRTEGLR